MGNGAASAGSYGYRWVQVTGQAAFAPRDGAGALVHQGRMWLLGGWNPPDTLNFPWRCNNEVWSSADGRDWRLDCPNTFRPGSYDPRHRWAGRHTAGYAVHRERLWIIGGDPLQGYYQSDVWSSADGTSWDCVCGGKGAVPWAPRALHYTVAFADSLWVMGGQTVPQFAPAPLRVYNDVWRSGDGRRWECVEACGPRWSPRGMIGGAAVHQGRIWVLGGGTYDTPETPTRGFCNDVWSSADGSHWVCHLAEAPWTPRQYHEVAVFDGRLWVLEGWNHGNRNDVWHSVDGVTWRELPGTPWAPRHAASVFVFADALWVVAGNNMESDVWRLERT